MMLMLSPKGSALVKDSFSGTVLELKKEQDCNGNKKITQTAAEKKDNCLN